MSPRPRLELRQKWPPQRNMSGIRYFREDTPSFLFAKGILSFINREVLAFMPEIVRRLSKASENTHEKEFLFQNPSVTVQRYTTRWPTSTRTPWQNCMP